MNYQVKIVLCFFSLLTLICYTAQGQTEKGPLESYQSRITFEGNKFEKDVTLNITKESDYLRLNVQGEIKDGRASATLYSKFGRKICGLGLQAKKGRQAKGNMGEVLEVREGIYILKIRNNGGHGFLNIDFSQY